MADSFHNLDDVRAHVAAGMTANGKAMLRLELAQGLFDAESVAWAGEWLERDDARESAEIQKYVDARDQERHARMLLAAENQAEDAVKATRFARLALLVSLAGLAVGCIALVRT